MKEKWVTDLMFKNIENWKNLNKDYNYYFFDDEEAEVKEEDEGDASPFLVARLALGSEKGHERPTKPKITICWGL